MPRQAIAFSSNEQRSNALDGARLLNLYPEQPPLGSRAPGLQASAVSSPVKSVLYGTPGLKLFETVGTGQIRALHAALGFLWALSGKDLYRIASDGSYTLCSGQQMPTMGTAMISDNGTQVAVLSAGLTFVVGEALARFSFDVTDGSLSAGVNKIASITVNTVEILSAAVDWSDSNSATATAIAANINAYSSSPEYTATTRGQTVIISAAASTGAGPNGFAVVLTTAGNFFVSPTSGTMTGGQPGDTTVAQVTAAAYPSGGASSIDYIDGYTVWTRSESTQWFISGLYDTTAIDPLDFASAESTPANILRVMVNLREVWIFKAIGIEVWSDTGASPFPFERNNSAVFERGCAAALSPAKIDNSVFWLGDDRIVYRATGYQPSRISGHWLEGILRAASTVSDAYGMTYTQDGHAFYMLTFPTLGRTFVYDVATQGWHERQSGTTLTPAAWSVACIAAAFGKVYAGIGSGQVCELDLDTYTEAGAIIRRAAITAPFYADGLRSEMPDLELECELGVGLSAGQGVTPQAMLRWSDDGGATWSNQRQQPIGAMGKRRIRTIFRRLGTFRQREYEISISDPVKVALFGLRYDSANLIA